MGFLYCFRASNFIGFCPFPSICFVYFARFSRWKLRSLTWKFPSFLMEAFSAMTVPPSAALATSHTFYYVAFSFSSMDILFLLRLPLRPMDYLKVHWLVSKCLEISPILDF